LALAFIYCYGPSRQAPRWRWPTWGSAFAAAPWLAASCLFSWYTANFGNYNQTYGSLGAIIGFMTWLWISAIAVLFGAEVDAEMEHQTARDNTEGSPKPMGARGAEMADTMGSAKADCGRRAFAAKLVLDVAMKRRRISSAALTALVLVFPRLAGSGEAILTVNRQKLQIETLGEFGPAVVFLAGLGNDSSTWKLVLSQARSLHSLEWCSTIAPDSGRASQC